MEKVGATVDCEGQEQNQLSKYTVRVTVQLLCANTHVRRGESKQ